MGRIDALTQEVEDLLHEKCDYRRVGATPESIMRGVEDVLPIYFKMLSEAKDDEEGSLTFSIESIITTLKMMRTMFENASQNHAYQTLTGKNPFEMYWGQTDEHWGHTNGSPF